MEPGPVPGYLEESESEDGDVSCCVLCSGYVPVSPADYLLRRHLVKQHLVTTSHIFVTAACTSTEELKKKFIESANKNRKDAVTPRKPTKPTPAVRRSRSVSSDIQDPSAKRRKIDARDNAGDKKLTVPVSIRKGRSDNLMFANNHRLNQHAKKNPRALTPCEKCNTQPKTFNEMLSHVKSCKVSPLRSSTPSKDNESPSDLNDKPEPRDQLIVSEDEGEGNREVQPDKPVVEMDENIQENVDAEEENVNPGEDGDKAAEDDPDVSGFVGDEEGEVDFAERRSEDTEGEESSDDENSGRHSRSDVEQNEDNKSQEGVENLKDNDDYQNPEEEDATLQEWFDNVGNPSGDFTKSESNGWVCKDCNQSYTRKGNLVRHQRRDHGYSSSPIRQRSKTALPQIEQPTARRPRSKTVHPKAQDTSVVRRSRSKSSLPARPETEEPIVRANKLDHIPNPNYFAMHTNMFGLFKEEHRAFYNIVDPQLPEGWKKGYNTETKKYKFLPPDEDYFLKSKIGVYQYMLGLPGKYSEEELERVRSSLSVAVRKQLESE